MIIEFIYSRAHVHCALDVIRENISSMSFNSYPSHVWVNTTDDNTITILAFETSCRKSPMTHVFRGTNQTRVMIAVLTKAFKQSS